MTITKTNYTIDNQLRVWLNGSMQAQIMGKLDDALHCIWVLEGKKKAHFYTAIGETVYLNVPIEHYNNDAPAVAKVT